MSSPAEALLKSPPALIAGAVVLGLVIFAMRGSNSGAGGRLAATIESQRITANANVALSDITAHRDVSLAQASNDRAAIAATRAVQSDQNFLTAHALAYSHDEAMGSLDMQRALGTLQINASREVANNRIAADVHAIDQATSVRHATLAVQNTIDARHVTLSQYMADLSGGLQRELISTQSQLATNPALLSHVQALASIDAERQKAIAQISASAASRNFRANTVTAAGANLFGKVLNGIDFSDIGSWFGGDSGSAAAVGAAGVGIDAVGGGGLLEAAAEALPLLAFA